MIEIPMAAHSMFHSRCEIACRQNPQLILEPYYQAKRAALILAAELLEAREALAQVLPYMEAAETAGLVGDEGCHWPVEAVRAALTDPEAR